jgi:hypothetical protein
LENTLKPTKTPECYLSYTTYGWSLILQEMPLCNHKETAAEALAVAKTFRVDPHPTHYWDGTIGDFAPRADADHFKAEESAAFTLQPTPAPPKKDTTLPLF